MDEITALDGAHAAMQADGGDDAARLRFYERLSDGELFLLLREEPAGREIEPEIFRVEGNDYVLAFDLEARLAQFVGRVAPYAALSGRAVASMLASQGIGLGVNLDVAPSAILIPPDAVKWLSRTLAQSPDETEAKIDEISAPKGLPQSLLMALDAKLAVLGHAARSAYLVAVRYNGGGRGHLLGFIDAPAEAEASLTQAVSEALTFSGIEAGALDVTFFPSNQPIAARMAKVGLRFDLARRDQDISGARPAPGSDPDKPPILR